MMSLEFLPFPFLAGLVILSVMSLFHWLRTRTIAGLSVFALFGLYLLILIGLTLFPIPVLSTAERSPMADIFAWINLVPFRYKWAADLYPTVILREILGNILLTIPFGFGISFMGRRPARQALGWVLGIGFMIEGAQLAASLAIGAVYRGVDIDDVILNGLGALVGYALFRLFAWIVVIVKRRSGIQFKGFGACLEQVLPESGSDKKP